jgi:hypothetical protein
MSTDYDMSIHTNPDPQAWAAFFMETINKNPDIEIDESFMIAWFANVMMAKADNLTGVHIINGDHMQHLIDEGKL